jgi:integrase
MRVATRRGAGEGSVYQRASDGLWIGTVDLGRGPDGKRRRRAVAARTKREALAKLDDARRLAAGGIVPDAQATVASLIDSFLDGHHGRQLKPATLANYRTIADAYIVPYVGHIKAAKLTPEHLRRWLDALEDAGKSANTRRLARAVLRRSLALAERDGLVARNAAALVDGPRGVPTRLDDALTAEEARKVLQAAEGDRLEALVHVLLTLGLRRGEALALRWDGVDLKAKTIRVEGAFTRSRGKAVYSTPKTSTGARTIPLVGDLPAVLREHRRRQSAERLTAGELWRDGGWVFTTEIGTPLEPSNAYHWWQRLTERAGVGRRRMHAARHTAATLMLDRGVPLELVSAVLGHAGLAITADVYARPTADAKRRALEQLVGAFGASSPS